MAFCRSYLVYIALVAFAILTLSSEAFAQQSAQAEDILAGSHALSDARLFASGDPASVPVNIQVPSGIVSLVREMWLRSPTFRRQCARIAQADDWRIQVMFQGVPFGDAWAKTNFENRNGARRAVVVLVVADARTVELIAHEFEHILEQLDGVNLVHLEEMGARGVRRLSNHGFETERAVEVGKRVAREFALVSQRASNP